MASPRIIYGLTAAYLSDKDHCADALAGIDQAILRERDGVTHSG